MCGIAGAVSVTGYLTDAGAQREAMHEVPLRRGPDAVGEWSSPHAVFIPRRLAVVDLVDGAQPAIATDDAGQDSIVQSYTGEVFNAGDLRDGLRRHGHQFRDRSDTEVVLRTFQEWGAGCAERLRGMFAFASEPKGLFATGLIQPVVDRTGLLEALPFTPTPGRSAFRGVREVIPCEVVRYSRNGITNHRYWTFQVRPHTDDPAPRPSARICSCRGNWVAVIPTNDDLTVVSAYFPQSMFPKVRTDPAAWFDDAVRQTAPDAATACRIPNRWNGTGAPAPNATSSARPTDRAGR